MSPTPEQPWRVCDRFLELRSHWLTLIGEHLEDHQGVVLEYWRIEKADSVIILPIQNHQILLPAPSYRPGVGQATLDFPGGRVPQGADLKERAIAILQRELGIAADAITHLSPLNPDGWPVNSSFSNQKLYGFVAHIAEGMASRGGAIAQYPATLSGINDLLQQLTCLQCRAILLQWWFNASEGFDRT